MAAKRYAAPVSATSGDRTSTLNQSRKEGTGSNVNVGDTSRTSPLQEHLTVLKVTVTVCHTAEHYGEEYDD